MGEAAPATAAAELWPACLPYYTGWILLHAGRQYGSAGMAGAFPLGFGYGEMRQYIADQGVTDPTDIGDWVHLLRAMDDEFLKFANERITRK